MDTNAFYQTVAGFCFTLVGLWWAVVQFRHEEWMGHPSWRRLVYSVHLSFMVPGVMSLGAMAAGEIRLIWRLVFILASLFAIIALIYLTEIARTTARDDRWAYHGWFIHTGRWLTILLYALVAAVAIDTNVVKLIAPDIAPLQVEGLLLTLMMFLGASVAWDFLAAPKPEV
jgi:hypothetical protein